ncbi:hypothetical protein BH11MYX4_BH11MYX4_62460 [soil metagenome]
MGCLQRLALFVTTAALAASSSSCFAVTNLDRFEQGGGSSSNFNDLRLTVRGMTSHVNELFEYRIVDSTNTLQSRGQIFPLGGPDATMFARGAVPKQNGPFTLDFYADHDNSGNYDRDEKNGTGDHSWRIPLTDALLDDNGVFVVTFDHNTSFSVLTSPAPPREYGSPATVHLTNMGTFVGKRVEVRIADASSKRVVVLYRVPILGKPTYDVTVPGMIEGGVTYTVEIYTDDGATPAGAVRAFRVTKQAAADGLDLTFDPVASAASAVTDAQSP